MSTELNKWLTFMLTPTIVAKAKQASMSPRDMADDLAAELEATDEQVSPTSTDLALAREIRSGAADSFITAAMGLN